MKWYDGARISNCKAPFKIIIGGRGIGKTYYFLKEMYKRYAGSDRKFIYLRTQQSEIEQICTPEGNPFKALNGDGITCASATKIGKIAAFYTGEEKDKEIFGYGLGLTVFGNFRGIDFSDVDTVLYEEFNTVTSRPVKNKFNMFFNLYETVNRNRELKGQPPVVVYMLSNSTSLDNDILSELDVIAVIEKMIKQKSNFRIVKDGLVAIELVGECEISELKASTVAYRLTKGSSFFRQAIENEFTEDSWYNVKPRKITEYRPVVEIDGIYIYSHKSNGTFYACTIKADCPSYSMSENRSWFIRAFGMKLQEAMFSGNMLFSDYTTKLKLYNILC